MSKVNSNEEILEFAIAKEVEAYHFYMALAGIGAGDHEVGQDDLHRTETGPLR
ncbi:MAG: hypothetical protein ACYS74_21235 [Planctomycetota bacterium]|jgi:hypothetical protein